MKKKKLSTTVGSFIFAVIVSGWFVDFCIWKSERSFLPDWWPIHMNFSFLALVAVVVLYLFRKDDVLDEMALKVLQKADRICYYLALCSLMLLMYAASGKGLFSELPSGQLSYWVGGALAALAWTRALAIAYFSRRGV